MTDEVITLDVTWKNILWKCHLVVICQSSTYKIVQVIKLFKKMPQGILIDFFVIIIIYFYN